MEYSWVLSMILATISTWSSAIDEEEWQTRIHNFQLYIASYRNSTGQWVVVANSSALMPNRNLEEGEKGEDISMDVKLVVTTGEGREVVQLYNTATVNIPHYTPPDYIQFPEVGFYKVHGHPLTWYEARLKCVAEGADLMVLDTPRSVEVFKELLSQFSDDIQRATGYDVAHVGIYDLHKNNTFLTVRGNPVNGSLWFSDQPSGDDNYCCYAGNSAALVNYKCNARLSYICERRLE